MRLTALLFTAILVATPAWAQQPSPSSKPDASSPSKDASKEGTKDQGSSLPVSIDKIKKELEQPPVLTLRGLDDKPTFKLEVRERQKISLDDLIKSLDFKAGPVPAGGVYAYEMQRQMWNPTNNPLVQPYAAFNQGQLLTILVENLVGKYLAGKAAGAVTSAMRERAIAQAREEVQQTINEYCAAQPNHGAGIEICGKPIQ
ncbi:MAG TPA: hypothetical protein VGQ16_06970 [Vicinamibacterales bacterium]|jgi:hypothetical protein|nr:hypothetical protein [Vicinamibacterales bacterium]